MVNTVSFCSALRNTVPGQAYNKSGVSAPELAAWPVLPGGSHVYGPRPPAARPPPVLGGCLAGLERWSPERGMRQVLK